MVFDQVGGVGRRVVVVVLEDLADDVGEGRMLKPDLSKNGPLADEDQEDEEALQHVQAIHEPEEYLEQWSKITLIFL